MQKATGQPAIILFTALLFSACVKDKPVKGSDGSVVIQGGSKVYVVNEGGFGYGNASVSLYDPATGNVVEDIYRAKNGADLGDVAQSLSKVAGRFYLVVNNSGKIVVCDENFSKTAQISGLASPRYLQAVTYQKAYVSDYNAGSIAVVDLNSNQKIKSIRCPGWTERMAMIYNKVFVANLRRSFVYVVNTLNDEIMDSVGVGPQAAGLVLDRHDKLWVLSAGDKTAQVAPRLCRIDPVTLSVELSLTFGSDASPRNLCLNATRDTLYFLNDGIFRMPVTDQGLPQHALVDGMGRNYYGLGISPSGIIYAADALDYSQRSVIYCFSPSGNPTTHFTAGVNASGFYFE